MAKASFFFFFNDTATTEIYTLSLHDALPILTRSKLAALWAAGNPTSYAGRSQAHRLLMLNARYDLLLPRKFRSEEHTSELQSQSNLVCRLLLEKKKEYTQ